MSVSTGPEERSKKGYAGVVVQYTLLVVVALTFIVPVYWMVSGSLKDLKDIFTFPPQWIPTNPQFDNYVKAWTAAPFGRFFINSVVTTFFGVVLEVGNSLLTAYALVFLRFPGKNLIFLVLLAALFIPIEMTMIANYATVAWLGWVDTYQGIVMPGASVVVGMFLLRQHFLTIPKELIEAARLDGASNLQILWRIVIPISTPMVVTVALLSVVAKWNAYLWPLIVTNSTDMKTLPIGLAYLFNEQGSNQWGVIMAATIFIVAPIIVLFLRWQKHIVEGLTSGATKG